MSTTGKSDVDGNPGSDGHWKDGFNLDCGVPTTLLFRRPLNGPWIIYENVRASKNRFYVYKAEPGHAVRVVGARLKELPTAYIGDDKEVAVRLCERLNGWEESRNFPVKV